MKIKHYVPAIVMYLTGMSLWDQMITDNGRERRREVVSPLGVLSYILWPLHMIYILIKTIPEQHEPVYEFLDHEEDNLIAQSMKNNVMTEEELNEYRRKSSTAD